MQRIKITLEMHPDDYKRMREAAQSAQMPETAFCALAIHKGVKVLLNDQAAINALLHPLDAGVTQ
ncbi:hypothetical protein ACNRBS_03700 [Ralstonia pseudosolanacearum]|uniref:hypothetical protein n=1 Tax=Ralstonia pseudosolanacearum TaxID=1310165 RepID=UPI0014020587|nr:hypothetical protein [Ralstonia pseudosolanacearum]KAF3458109.1 hypothetical protein GO278_005133 [Ralstonia solanacearum]NKG01740.1 hypothetical protein [Ralstonia solanacearum]UNJ33130.1 hypothetical protein MNY32_26140 [Ralstonia pseudosolanacearum]